MSFEDFCAMTTGNAEFFDKRGNKLRQSDLEAQWLNDWGGAPEDRRAPLATWIRQEAQAGRIEVRGDHAAHLSRLLTDAFYRKLSDELTDPDDDDTIESLMEQMAPADVERCREAAQEMADISSSFSVVWQDEE